MHPKLITRIVGLAILSALLPVAALVVLALTGEDQVENAVERELNTLARRNVAQIARDVNNLCQTVHQMALHQADQALHAVEATLERGGGISLSPRTTVWEATNQDTGETISIELPKVLYGDMWPDVIERFSVPAPVVDDVTEMTGLKCSIFQRMNEQGDMLRVVSSVPGEDGKRATGSFIPAKSTDQRENAIIEKILRGEHHAGLIFVAGKLYLAAYMPLRGDDGDEIIGMIGVGTVLQEMEYLRRTIQETTVGKTGYVWVVGGMGEDRGYYIVSKAGERDGENVWETKDSSGRFFVQDMVKEALTLEPGEVAYYRYPWQNPGDTEARTKLSAFTYFKPWDWVIGAGVYEDDYYDVKHRVRQALQTILSRVLLVCLMVLAVALALAMLIGSRIVSPIARLTFVARRVAEGDLHNARKELESFGVRPEENESPEKLEARDETGQLAAAFMGMTESLHSLVGQVQEAGVHVAEAASEISASARTLQNNVTQQATTINEVSNACRDISGRSHHLVDTMSDATQTVLESANLAEEGRTALQRMDANMRQLLEATSSITSRLSIISDKTNEISTIVTTIGKVADQTNLLSLNAAIEAEKAGSFGSGFSVVAREIRTLADHTASATLEIERMVKEARSAVASGVMETDKFVQSVRNTVQDVHNISAQLAQVIDQNRELFPHFEKASEAVESQSSGATEIHKAIRQVSDLSEETRQAMADFISAADQLTLTVQGMQDEVARFKTDA